MGKRTENSYLEILDSLSKEPILKLPDYDKDFILKTDASGVGFGGALVQIHDGIEHPVSFFSGSFTKAQSAGWNHWQKEAFAVIAGVKRFDHFLRSNPFTIVTDNASLLQLLKPNQPLTNPMLIRWNLLMTTYDYKIIHRPGIKLVIEDGLSRSINFYNINIKDIINDQKDDTLIHAIKAMINHEAIEENEIYKKALTLINMNKDNFIIKENILYYFNHSKRKQIEKIRIVVPKSLEKEIIKTYHDAPSAGHLGIEKTYYKISKQFWFDDMFRKIEDYCKKCAICDKNRKFHKTNDILHPIETTAPFQIVELDHCGPFPTTKKGNTYVLTIIDHFSRKRWFIGVKSTSAEDTFIAFLNICSLNLSFLL